MKKSKVTEETAGRNRMAGTIALKPSPRWVVHWLLSCAGILHVFGLLTDEERQRVRDELFGTGVVVDRPGKKGKKS